MKKYFMMHLKTKLEYKVSFILTLISQLLVIFTSIFVIYSLFNKFKLLKEFSIYECLLTCSIVQLGYYTCEFIFRGFDKFSDLIKNGNFDILLIRPENIYLQIIGSEIGITKISRVFASAMLFIFAYLKCHITFSLLNIIILSMCIISSIIIFLSLFIIGASISFYTIEGLEIINIFTTGSRQLGEYPMGIYSKKVLLLFTFVIPISCVNYYPILYVFGHTNNLLYTITPIFAIFIFLFSILFFNISLKHYQSSGS